MQPHPSSSNQHLRLQPYFPTQNGPGITGRQPSNDHPATCCVAPCKDKTNSKDPSYAVDVSAATTSAPSTTGMAVDGVASSLFPSSVSSSATPVLIMAEAHVTILQQQTPSSTAASAYMRTPGSKKPSKGYSDMAGARSVRPQPARASTPAQPAKTPIPAMPAARAPPSQAQQPKTSASETAARHISRRTITSSDNRNRTHCQRSGTTTPSSSARVVDSVIANEGAAQLLGKKPGGSVTPIGTPSRIPKVVVPVAADGTSSCIYKSPAANNSSRTSSRLPHP